MLYENLWWYSDLNEHVVEDILSQMRSEGLAIALSLSILLREYRGDKQTSGAHHKNIQSVHGILKKTIVFQGEAMNAASDTAGAVSRLTLALLEDSGWYKPNYK